MDITRKRIINPQRYLYALHPGDKFYIAVPLAEEDYPRLQFYGLLPDSPARIPIPRRAATTLLGNLCWVEIHHTYLRCDYHFFLGAVSVSVACISAIVSVGVIS